MDVGLALRPKRRAKPAAHPAAHLWRCIEGLRRWTVNDLGGTGAVASACSLQLFAPPQEREGKGGGSLALPEVIKALPGSAC